MSQTSPSALRATNGSNFPGPPRIALEVAFRKVDRGLWRIASVVDHCVSIHTGAPVRVSCHGGATRSVTTRGEINLVPEGSVDECFVDDESDALDVRVPRTLVRRAAEEMGLDPDRAGLEPQYCIRDHQIEHIAWALEAEQRAGSPSGLLYRESLGLALAAHLLTRYRATATPRAGLWKPQLARVVEYIEAHLTGDVSLLRLAAVAGVSGSHFRVQFKRSTGVPVHEYVIQRRVERARKLLVEGELPASQVAFEAGFSHQSHMARCMRRVLGVTPAVVARSRGGVFAPR